MGNTDDADVRTTLASLRKRFDTWKAEHGAGVDPRNIEEVETELQSAEADLKNGDLRSAEAGCDIVEALMSANLGIQIEG